MVTIDIDKLIREYEYYEKTEEALAVLFVKKYLSCSKGKWIDIVDIKPSRYFEPRDLEFRGVLCELFNKKITPKYPERNKLKDPDQYLRACRAITWNTAHEDIERQRSKGVHGEKFIITGIKYNANKNKSFFVDAAPPEIKELEKNVNDRTDPRWDYALRYRRPEKWIFKIKSIVKTDTDWID